MKKLLDLIYALVKLINRLEKRAAEEKVTNAAHESLEKQDQRVLEEALGGSSGPVDESRFPGVYERPRKTQK